MFPGSLSFFDQEQPRWFISSISSADSSCSEVEFDIAPQLHGPSSVDHSHHAQEQETEGGGFLGSGITSMLGCFFQRILALTDEQPSTSVCSSTSDLVPEEATSSQSNCIDPDFACPICLQLLYQPVSTSCGHTFCHDCIHIAFDRKRECPVCRSALSSVPSLQGVNSLLRTLIIKTYPDLYEARSRGHGGLPQRYHHLIKPDTSQSLIHPLSMVGSLTSSKDDIDNISIGDWGDGSSDDSDSVSSISSVDLVFPSISTEQVV